MGTEKYPIPDLPIDEKSYYEAVADVDVGLVAPRGPVKAPEENGVYDPKTYEELLTLFHNKNIKIMEEVEDTRKDLKTKIQKLQKLLEEMYPAMLGLRELYQSTAGKIVAYNKILDTLDAVSKANEARQEQP